MELLKEWLSKSESNLYILGVALAFAALVLPAKKENYKKDCLLVAICFSIYIICEAIMSIAAPTKYSLVLTLLFVGGCSLSVAVGRIVRLYLMWIFKIIKSIIEWKKGHNINEAVDEVNENQLEIEAIHNEDKV